MQLEQSEKKRAENEIASARGLERSRKCEALLREENEDMQQNQKEAQAKLEEQREANAKLKAAPEKQREQTVQNSLHLTAVETYERHDQNY